MFFGSLRIDICAHRLKRRTTDTANEVSTMPEQRLAVERCKMRLKPTSGASCAGRLKIVNQYRNIECRMDVDQQVDMIRLAAEFHATGGATATPARR